MKVIDLTHTIHESMPVYPGTEPPKFLPANSYEKDGFKETLLTMFTHTGTHMDPPAHLFAGRTTLDRFPPEQFIGKALVIDCVGLAEGAAITMEHIRRYGDKAENGGLTPTLATTPVLTARCCPISRRGITRASAST